MTVAIVSLLSLLSLISLADLLALGYLQKQVVQAKREAQEKIYWLFTSEGKDEKGNDKFSPFDQFVDAIGQVFAARIGSTVIAALRGGLGGTMKGVNEALESEAINSSPGLGLLSALSPNLTKKLGKNPLAMMALQGVIQKVLGGDGSNASTPATLTGHTTLTGRKHHE